MSGKRERWTTPCAYCGKDTDAARGNSTWGHSEMCCSDRCGFLYFASPKRNERDIAYVEAHLRSLEQTLERLRAYRPALFETQAHVRRARYHEHEAATRAQNQAWFRSPADRREYVQVALHQAWVDAIAALVSP